MNDLRTPLARARGLGSAKDGTMHWWLQRVSAVALAPLSIWFLFCALPMLGAGYADARVWLAQPVHATLILALLLALIHHAFLGVQVVIEDYVHERWLEVGLMVAIRLLAFLAATASVLAVVRIAVGG